MSESATTRAARGSNTPDAGTSKTAPTVPGDTDDRPGGALARRAESNPDDRGFTAIADVVVAKIAGIATREVDGVHDVGGATQRAVGKVREVLPGTSSSTTQGINVEVGERQAAVDLSIVAEYGVAVHRLAAAIRRNVINAIEQMTGLEVTEVNITVEDVRLADDDDEPETVRVQ